VLSSGDKLHKIQEAEDEKGHNIWNYGTHLW